MVNRYRKLLLVGNGGISIEAGNIAFTGKDMGQFISSLKKDGFEITFIDFRGCSVNNKFIYTYNLTGDGIKYYVIHGGRRNPMRYIGFLNLAYHILMNDSVYLYYPGGFSKVASRLCTLLRKKYGVYVRGYGIYIPDAKRKSEPENVFTDNFILKNSSYIITVSPKMQLELLELNKKVCTVTDIIWDIKDSYLREDTHYPITLWKFLFIGSVVELKGIAELIDSTKILNERGLNFKLRIVGDGYLLQDLINKQNLGEIPPNIEFAGSIIDKKSLEEEYQSADALVFPTRTEGFPRSLYEAMLKRLPIFTTMVGGIQGIMEPGYNCIELPVRNPKGQADAILSGIENPELMKRISENGYETIKAILSQMQTHSHVLLGIISNIDQPK